MKNSPRKLDFLAKCSLCGASYQSHNILNISRNETRVVYHLTCSDCLMSSLVFVTQSKKGLISLGMMTDLGKDEVAEKFHGQGITADEVIEVYQLLKE